MIKHRISASVEIGWETLMEARSYQDAMGFALSKLARGLAQELLKREDIHSRKENYQGVTLSAEFYCLTGEQLDQIVHPRQYMGKPQTHHHAGTIMTNQHPLTDEICKGLVVFPLESEHDYIEMRAAYDLGRDAQLEEVIHWLKEDVSHSLLLEVTNTGVTYPNTSKKDKSLHRLDLDWIVDDLREAMRPTKRQEEN